MALAASDAKTAGSEVFKKNKVFDAVSRMRGLLELRGLAHVVQKAKTRTAASVMAMMDALRSCVSPNTTTNAASVETPCAMNDFDVHASVQLIDAVEHVDHQPDAFEHVEQRHGDERIVGTGEIRVHDAAQKRHHQHEAAKAEILPNVLVLDVEIWYVPIL